MRDEYLNKTMFCNIAHARDLIAVWVTDYRTEKPHLGVVRGAPCPPGVHRQGAGPARCTGRRSAFGAHREHAAVAPVRRRGASHRAGNGPPAPQFVSGNRGGISDFAALHAMQPIVLTLDEARDEALACTEGEALLRRHPEIDAMLVQVDAFAVGLMEAARRIGRRVPHDLQLATRYDSIRAKLSSPPLTAVDLHLAQVATLAVELLLDSQNGAPPEPAHPLPSLLPRRFDLSFEYRRVAIHAGPSDCNEFAPSCPTTLLRAVKKQTPSVSAEA